MDIVKFLVSIIFFASAYWGYSNVRGKKPLLPGDNQFFIEDKNKICPITYYKSWGLVLWGIAGGIVFVVWAFE